MKLYFISGLPRSGSSIIQSILSQNSEIYSDKSSFLANCFNNIHLSWNNVESEKYKKNVLFGILKNYYKDIEKSIVFDKHISWINNINLLENLLGEKVKILCPVRNPAEILSSFEKTRRNNPINAEDVGLTIAARCLNYAGPNGTLGLSHAYIKDAITTGFLDRILFLDYNRFCNSPKSQTKRIYDFFELPFFEHDYSKIKKTTINCVQYLGLDLYEQYNREIFWDAWV